MRILLDPFAEADRLVRQPGTWVVGVIETRIFWPKKRQLARFDGTDFLLIPAETTANQTQILPGIALNCTVHRLEAAAARKLIMAFASSLSWSQRSKIEIVGWMGGSRPTSMGLMRNNSISDYLDCDELPSPNHDDARAALAFYREGVSLDNPFYAFLSLYKAFCRAVPGQRDRTPWINNNLGRLSGEDALKRATDLSAQSLDVGAYLYGSCRNHIAHADREPFINPDDTEQHLRLEKDIPLMRAITELAIEESFGIERQATAWRRHLHELSGFRELIPPDILSLLTSKSDLPDNTSLDFPDEFFVLVKRGHEVRPLGKMSLVSAASVEGGLLLQLGSQAETIRLNVVLDFSKERLLSDPIGMMGSRQDRSSRERIKEQLDVLRARRCWLSNGRLEIWDVLGEKRYGCSEAYIPHNCFVNTEFFDQAELELSQLLASSEAT